jgi:dTDP-glucose 4,6-dehydratase
VKSASRGACFLTGGTGFVGSSLIAGAPDDVRIVVLTRDPERFKARAPELASRVELHRGDVTTFEFPAGDFSHVIHGASDTRDAIRDPREAWRTIVDGTRRVLEFAGTKRFLMISSGAVYGTAGDPYGDAKRAAEELCPKDAAIARLFTFIGPYMSFDKPFAIIDFIRAAMEGRAIRVQQPETRRSYLYGADLARWLWTMLDRGTGVYDVGSDEVVTMAELAEIVRRVVNPGVQVQRGNGGAASTYVPNIDRATRELGLTAEVALDEAITRTVEWYRQR